MKVKTSLGKRLLALFMSITMMLGMMPATFASANNAEYGVVEAITAGASIENADGAEPTVSYSSTDLVWSAKDPSIGRMYDGWWVGIKITAPAGMTTQSQFEVDADNYVKYQTLNSGGWSADKSFWNAQDSDKNVEDTARYLTMWVMLNEDILNTAKNSGTTVNYKWQFDWNMDGHFEQVVSLVIDPAEVTLSKDSAVTYPSSALGTVTLLSGNEGTVSGNGTNHVVVSHGAAVLDWVAADATVGRGQDGWWMGVRVDAPARMTAEALQNAKYARLESDGTWTVDLPFGTNRDSDTHIELWKCVNDVETGNMPQMSWKFDWDNDGVYEQLIELKADAANTVLMQDGTLIYPEPGFGTVTLLSGSNGSVFGNATADVVVTHGAAELNWVVADATVGRGQDGWWMGIRVDVPTGMSVAGLENAKYARLNSDGTWAEGISFWANRDSDAHIELWKCVNEFENGTMPEMSWKFDWDNDGVYEQVITLEPDLANTVLKKEGAQVYPAAGYGTVTLLSGSNGSITDNGSANVVVSHGSAVLEWVEKDATVNRNQDGWWMGIRVVAPANMPSYVLQNAKYARNNGDGTWVEGLSFWANKDSETHIELWRCINEFENGTMPEMSWKFDWNNDGVYEQLITLKPDLANTKLKKDGVQVYPKLGTVTAISGGIEVQGNGTGSVTLANTGTVSLQWVAKNENRTEDGWWVGIQMNVPEGMTPAQLENSVYQTKNGSAEWVGPKSFWSNRDSDAHIELWMNVNDLYQTNENKVCQWQFDWDNDGEYEQLVVLTLDREKVELGKTTQADFGFETRQPSEQWIGEGTYQNIAVGGSGDGEITYEVVEGAEFASIDAETGVLTFEKVGTVKVKATKATDSNGFYEKAYAEYTVMIVKKNPTIVFEKGDAVDVVYGTTEYINPIQVPEGVAVSYEIVGENKIGASVNDDGTVTFADSVDKVGTITIKATVAEDAFYNLDIASYTLTVNYLATPDVPYTLEGETKNESGWYTGDITIKAPEGYLISKSGNDLSTSDWADSIVHSTEGVNSIVVYLKDTDGYMTGAIEIVDLKLDKTVPVVEITYDNMDVVNDKYYNADRIATVKITEANFSPDAVVFEVIAKNIAGVPVEYTYSKLTAEADWKKDTENENTWIAEVSFKVDANYQVSLKYTDIAGWALEEDYAAEFIVDKTAPENMSVTYSESILSEIINALTFGFYKADSTVTLQVEDVTSGVDHLAISVVADGSEGATDVVLPENLIVNTKGEVITGSKGFIGEISAEEKDGIVTLSFKVPAQFRGEISFKATDLATWNSDYEDVNVVVVDTISPKVKITFDGELKDKVTVDSDVIDRQTVTAVDANTRFVYNGDITATLKVTEANFFEDSIKITVMRDGEAVTDCEASAWVQTENPDEYMKTLTLSEDGDYVISVEFADKSANEMEWSSEEYEKSGTKTYQSNIHTIDKTAPVVEVTYDNNEVFNDKYYNADRTATIKITDRNFRPNEVVFKVEATDVAGDDIKVTKGEGETVLHKETFSELTAWADWKQDPENENTWIAEVPFAVDANYLVSLSYTDIAGRSLDSVYEADFVVDKIKPENLTITYSESDLEKLISGLTFGYYKADATVTLIATDATAGVKYFELGVLTEGSEGATDVELPKNLIIGADGSVVSGSKGFIGEITAAEEDGTVKISFKVPAQFRGELFFDAVDLADWKTSYDDSIIVVVDDIAPDRKVTYAPSRIVKLSDMTDVSEFTEDDEVVLYYNKDVVAALEITEANFYAEDIVVKVNDEEFVLGEWENTTGDTWTNEITLTEEGDYIITIEYPDRSGNKMVEYKSQRIVIDRTAPVISVAYGNGNVQSTENGRKYFNSTQTATITIKEHNFRADDAVIMVNAKNIVGAELLNLNASGVVESYASQGTDRTRWSAYQDGSWRREDDTYVITLVFDAEANYSFDVAYTDLATNVAADYSSDYFTVDRTAPENLSVSYSTSVFEQILESITFGYYNAEMTVTITATDDISGVHYFTYSYINSAGVSSVNAELIDQRIHSAEISYNGNTATASFKIPKMVLGNDNQFNGTVAFAATDRSLNSKALADSKRIVVDNISPTSVVTYNEPVKEADGVSYYDGNINVSAVITEANFFAYDVVVSVTKDGASYPVNISWSDNSVDVHTGTFTLTEEGDYTVSVQYFDKSGNQMETYTSGLMVLDTTIPSIQLSDVKMNSANKDAVYGFTLTVNDINLDASSLSAFMTAVVKDENGKYITKEIDLGEVKTVVQGQTYTYTIDNLPEDAIYTLTCSVQDMSGNRISEIALEDGKSYEKVQFSINRNGSTYGFGSEFTESLVDQYYVYSVGEDVIIVEVNVDPIENYTVTLNDKELVEGTDYTTEQSSEDGEWSMRVYTISKNLFAQEGEYNIIVSSTDKAESTAYSDVKGLAVAFVVDQTKPVLIISGLENGGRYQTSEQTVTLIPSDEGGRLNHLKVVLLDTEGNPLLDENGSDISVSFDMAGEELQQYLEANEGVVTFTIPEGLEYQVQITCNDCALNDEGVTNAYNETFTKVTVSQNQLVIFYANKPLFYGCIAGVGAVALTIIILLKRKKKNKEEKSK